LLKLEPKSRANLGFYFLKRRRLIPDRYAKRKGGKNYDLSHVKAARGARNEEAFD
jgi:hypothetical protein